MAAATQLAPRVALVAEEMETGSCMNVYWSWAQTDFVRRIPATVESPLIRDDVVCISQVFQDEDT